MEKYTVNKDGELLDYLVSNVSKSKNNIKSLLKFRQVSINGRITTQFDDPVKKDDIITLNSFVDRTNPRHRELDIIYEDDELIVIDKPAKLLSIANDSEKIKTAYRLVTEYVKKRDKKNRVFIIHRLDRDTSGILIFAKNEDIKKKLQADWNNIAKRRYLAITDGVIKKQSGTIKSFLHETKTHKTYSSVKDNGNLAITDYKVLNDNGRITLVEVFLNTGKKNQIRVHLSDIGHPIIGDKLYESSSNPIKRLGLHAHSVEIIHPDTKKKMLFTAKSPSSFRKLIKEK